MFFFILFKLVILWLKFFTLFIIFLIINFLFLNKNFIIKNNYEVYKIYNLDKIILNISTINYIFSFKYNITKIQYNISIYDKNHNIILPSNLGLYYKFHIFCHSNNIKKKISIIYTATIYNNCYFSCIDYINYNEMIKF